MIFFFSTCRTIIIVFESYRLYAVSRWFSCTCVAVISITSPAHSCIAAPPHRHHRSYSLQSFSP